MDQTLPVFKVLFGPHAKAQQVLESDPHLSPSEAFLLVECLHMRQSDRDFREYLRGRAEQDKVTAEKYKQGFIHNADHSLMPAAIWARFMLGGMFETQRDMQAQDHFERKRQSLTAERNKEFREHINATESEERRMRDALAAASPQAKRMFNTIAISKTTGQHFPLDEIRAAAHLPNPLEKLLF